MDPNLEFYKSILHLGPKERRQRMQQLPKEEVIRVKTLVEREQWEQRLEKQIAGRDIVDLALSSPAVFENSPPLQKALLGRACYINDEYSLVTRITHNVRRNGESLIQSVADFDQGAYPPLPRDAWILAYCDLVFVEGDSNTLREIYKTRLQEEELQTRTEKAREVARSNEMKLARRNAKCMIPALDQLSDEQLLQPKWESWGLTYYRSQEVEERYDNEWEQVWRMIDDSPQPPRDRDARDASWFGIHCQGKRGELMALHTEEWATLPHHERNTEDDAFRTHFKEYRNSLASPGILQNTFIVVPIELIPDNPGEDELHPYWVWAYDADWEASPEETIYNGEKYQGRVKVAFYSLNAWFYAARREGLSADEIQWPGVPRNPRKKRRHQQLTPSVDCRSAATCTTSVMSSRTITHSASVGAAKFISAGYSVHISQTSGFSLSCTANRDQRVCVKHWSRYQQYDVRRKAVLCGRTLTDERYNIRAPLKDQQRHSIHYCATGTNNCHDGWLHWEDMGAGVHGGA
ncbi:hypothetical protein FSPOR_4099 [Fusarium sporotrichioides]|uniref:Uncharacterized protein n=1 Tax=Fusarium sporotrichioides TaxID=5514 RepID=A0A395SDR5_FUSSP|nr:hypothetical protein FSPOR_4099 [Fusarium sporotrichioides]